MLWHIWKKHIRDDENAIVIIIIIIIIEEEEEEGKEKRIVDAVESVRDARRPGRVFARRGERRRRRRPGANSDGVEEKELEKVLKAVAEKEIMLKKLTNDMVKQFLRNDDDDDVNAEKSETEDEARRSRRKKTRPEKKKMKKKRKN